LLDVKRRIFFQVRPAQLHRNLAAIGTVGAQIFHGVHDGD
jgi:hypothetical protein